MRGLRSGGPDALSDGPHERSALDILAEEEVSARQSLKRQRDAALDRRSRHAGWLMLFGFGPGAIAAILLAMITDRHDLIWPFVGLGVGVQLFRIWREQRRIRTLDRALENPLTRM